MDARGLHDEALVRHVPGLDGPALDSFGVLRIPAIGGFPERSDELFVADGVGGREEPGSAQDDVSHEGASVRCGGVLARVGERALLGHGVADRDLDQPRA